jgi:hypothetical protein
MTQESDDRSASLCLSQGSDLFQVPVSEVTGRVGTGSKTQVRISSFESATNEVAIYLVR